MKTTAYKFPALGCYFDHGNYSVDELNHKTVGLALGWGWVLSDEDRIRLYAEPDADEERSNGPDIDYSEWLNELADEAIDWLNEQETRSFMYWANDGEAGAFGLWVNVDSAREDVGFVSYRTLADANRAGVVTDPEDSTYPAHDFRGEWLHVNDHGNATLYSRVDGKVTACNAVALPYFDIQIWSVV